MKTAAILLGTLALMASAPVHSAPPSPDWKYFPKVRLAADVSHPYESEFAPDVPHEMFVQDRRRQLVLTFISAAVFLGGAWLLDRQVRLRGATARRRGHTLAGFAGWWAIFQAGLVFAAVKGLLPRIFLGPYPVLTALGLVCLSLTLSLVVVVASVCRPRPAAAPLV